MRQQTAVVGVVLGLGACSHDQPTAPTATAPASTPLVGTLTGLVRGEAPKVGRSWRNHPALADATVTVVGGPNSGTTVVTGADGQYEIAATGTLKLRFEHPNFAASESIETTVTSSQIAMGEITLSTAPWTISGRIIDSLGNPVSNAVVAAGYFVEGFFFAGYGQIHTDSAGSYSLNSTHPHFATILLAVNGAGIVPMNATSATCCGILPNIESLASSASRPRHRRF